MARKLTAMMLILLWVFVLAACNQKASKYTEAEHFQRVSSRVDKHFMTEKYSYIGFEVFPLYNEHDELNFFLVEFEPYGFLYVLIRDERMKGFSWLGASTSMYRIMMADDEWSPYTIDEYNMQPYPDKDKQWFTDADGEKIVHKKSPYSVANIENEKRYLLQIDSQYTVVIKKADNKYLNLISMLEANVVGGSFTQKQAYAFIGEAPPKKEFDL